MGLIPARSGSKGIPRKNTKLLGGKPLLQYTAEKALYSKLLHKTILSSDDEECIALGIRYGLEVPFVRPEKLAEDNTPSIAVILHAMQFYEKKDIFFDAVCLLQPTTPFREPGLIDLAIQKFEKEGYDSLISVRKVPDAYNPHWVFKAESGKLKPVLGQEKIVPRRQELPTTYYRDGAIYLIKTQVLLQQHSLFGENIGFIDTSTSPYVNLDTPTDWGEAENIIKTKK